MLKVTIKGQVYSFDSDNYPLHLAIELEERLGMPFGAYLEQLGLGSAKAVAGFAWAVMSANGQDAPPLADILSGEYPLNITEIDISDEGGADPTGHSSRSTGSGGLASSPKSSATRPARSVS